MRKYIWLVILGLAALAYAADECTTTIFLKVKNGSYDVQRSVANYQTDQLTNAADQGIMNATPTATAIPINNVVQPKWTYLRNLGTQGAVTVTCTLSLGTNDIALLPLANTNIQVTAAAGTTNKLEYWINEK